VAGTNTCDSYEHATLELIKKVRTWGGIAITLAVAFAYKTVGFSTVDHALYNIMFNGVARRPAVGPMVRLLGIPQLHRAGAGGSLVDKSRRSEHIGMIRAHLLEYGVQVDQ
jgi:hypothetical protein